MSNLDPVNPKAVKKKFDDRKDKDIDNDGDVDSSDEYLHKRRKAISKALTKESVDLEENVDALAKEFEKRITKGGAIASDRIQDKERMAVLAMGKKKGVDMKALDAAIIKVSNRVNEEVDTSDAKKTELDEGNMASAAKELEAYARKSGGIDKGDFLKAVVMMKKGMKPQLNKFVDDLDTEPREKILHIMKKHLGEEVEHLEEGPFKGVSKQIMRAKVAGKRFGNHLKKMRALDKETSHSNKHGDYKDSPTYQKKAKELDKAYWKLSKKQNKLGNVQDRLGKKPGERDYDKWDYKKDLNKRKLLNKEEVEHLEEKYETNHKTFSSAVQHAKDQVQKRGYEIDGEEWSRKVALGPKKPSKGKTNRYTISLMKGGKETKKNLQMQVYYDEGRYELNMYID